MKTPAVKPKSRSPGKAHPIVKDVPKKPTAAAYTLAGLGKKSGKAARGR